MDQANSSQSRTTDSAGRRANAATPVFDPGLSSAGADAEAGGARARQTDAPAADPPRTTNPEAGGIGLRLTPRAWLIAAAVLVGALLVAGVTSL